MQPSGNGPRIVRPAPSTEGRAAEQTTHRPKELHVPPRNIATVWIGGPQPRPGRDDPHTLPDCSVDARHRRLLTCPGDLPCAEGHRLRPAGRRRRRQRGSQPRRRTPASRGRDRRSDPDRRHRPRGPQLPVRFVRRHRQCHQSACTPGQQTNLVRRHLRTAVRRGSEQWRNRHDQLRSPGVRAFHLRLPTALRQEGEVPLGPAQPTRTEPRGQTPTRSASTSPGTRCRPSKAPA